MEVSIITIGERIKTERNRKDISQIDLAIAINISKQNLYKYENNIILNIPSDKIEAIADCLKISPAVLMGWSEPQTSITLSPNEQDLLCNYRELNEKGQDKASEYISDLVATGRYKKIDENKKHA